LARSDAFRLILHRRPEERGPWVQVGDQRRAAKHPHRRQDLPPAGHVARSELCDDLYRTGRLPREVKWGGRSQADQGHPGGLLGMVATEPPAQSIDLVHKGRKASETQPFWWRLEDETQTRLVEAS